MLWLSRLPTFISPQLEIIRCHLRVQTDLCWPQDATGLASSFPPLTPQILLIASHGFEPWYNDKSSSIHTDDGRMCRAPQTAILSLTAALATIILVPWYRKYLGLGYLITNNIAALESTATFLWMPDAGRCRFIGVRLGLGSSSGSSRLWHDQITVGFTPILIFPILQIQ